VGTDGSLVGSAFDVPSSSVQHRNPALVYLSQAGRYAVAWEDNSMPSFWKQR